jgi:hypothetical protein
LWAATPKDRLPDAHEGRRPQSAINDGPTAKPESYRGGDAHGVDLGWAPAAPLGDKELEATCNQFFRESQGRTGGDDAPFSAGCKSLVLANLQARGAHPAGSLAATLTRWQLWRAIKQALEASSNANVGRILWRVQSEVAHGIVTLVRAPACRDCDAAPLNPRAR